MFFICKLMFLTSRLLSIQLCPVHIPSNYCQTSSVFGGVLWSFSFSVTFLFSFLHIWQFVHLP